MIWIIFLVLTLLLIAIELLIARKRPLLIQLIRAASHILSAVIAFAVAKAYAISSSAVTDTLSSSGTAADSLKNDQIAALASDASPILSAVVSPIVFLFSWIITGIIFYIIYKIIAVVLTKKTSIGQKNDTSGMRAASMVTGGLMAVLISFTVWMPFAGYAVTAYNMADAFLDGMKSGEYTVSEDSLQKIEEFKSASSSSMSAFRFINGTTGFIFRGLTTYKICGEKDNVYHDFPIAVSSASDSAKKFTEFYKSAFSEDESKNKSVDFDSFSDESINKIRNISNDMSKSLAYKSLAAYFLSGMSEAVRNNTSYLGINILADESSAQSKTVNNLIGSASKIFANTTPDTVCTDWNKLTDVICDMRDVAQTVTVISAESNEIKTDDIKKLFENINPESSDAVADAIVSIAEGLSESNKNIQNVALVVSDVYRAMGAAKANPDVSDADYEKEVASASQIISMASDGSSIDKQEALKTFSGSQVISSVIRDTAASSDTTVFDVSDDYKASLATEFEQYISENGSSEDISALAQLFGITLG